jgi:hypothetical protein
VPASPAREIETPAAASCGFFYWLRPVSKAGK